MVQFSFIIVSNKNFQGTLSVLNLIKKYKNNRPVEVLCVDQIRCNLLKSYTQIVNYKYFSTKDNSLSGSRNIALKEATGKYIILLDDDASLDDNYFENLDLLISEYPNYDIIGSRILCNETKKRYSRRHIDKVIKISNRNFDVLLSSGLIIKRKVFDNIGGFDEKFGVGSIWPACEESDFIIRAFKVHHKILYHPLNVTRHPAISTIKPRFLIMKYFNYGVGRGALVRKHLSFFGIDSVKQVILIPFVAFTIYLITFRITKSLCFIFSLFGRLNGFIKYKLSV